MKKLVIAVVVAAVAWGTPAVAGAQEEPPPFFVDEATLPFDALPGVPSERFWGLDENPGAAADGWRIEVPANWNGGLVLWAHGYRGVGPQLTVDNPALRPFLLANGWAWAASSFRANGYAVEEGVEDTQELLAIFAEQTGRTPQRVIAHGASMGGHVTGALIERYPDSYAGALPICGVMGDVALYDYFLDVNLVAQTLAGVEATIPPGPTYFTETIPAISAALGLPDDLSGRGYQFAAAWEQRSGGERPGFDGAFDYWNGEQTALGGIPFLFGVYGGALTGGQTDPRADAAAGNAGTVYQYDTDPALSPEEARLNEAVPRAPATGPPPFPVITGDLPVPVLSLHTTGDLFVPFSMEQIYAREAAAQGASDLLVVRAIRDVRHCGFAPQELATAFAELVAWIDAGVRPAGDDVLDPANVADRDFGCTFTAPLPVPERAPFPPCEAPPGVDQAGGGGPAATAVALSQATFDAAPAAVLADDDGYSDALAAAPLAGRVDGPLLLTPSQELPADVADEITRLGAGTVYLVGSRAVLSRRVEEQVAALGVTVHRLAGLTRYQTAAAVAGEVGGTEVVVARGAGDRPLTGFDAEGAAVSGLAAFLERPVLLVERHAVPPATLAALSQLGVTRITVAGGPGTVSDGVLALLRLATGAEVERLAGGDAYATSVAVAERSVASGVSPSDPWLATADDWPAAVAAGVAAAETGDYLLLTDPAGVSAAADWLRAEQEVLETVRTAGQAASPL